MKIVFILLFLFTVVCNAQWVQVNNGLGNISISSIVVAGNNIFAGAPSKNGVFLSTNNGTSWSQAGLYTQTVYSLTTSGNNIFAGTAGSGVFLSTNNGLTWTQILNNQNVFSLAASGNNIFAGCGYGNGVYLSTNNGMNWTQTSLNNQWVNALVVNGNNIFAGTYNPGNGVYLSTNNGTTWIQTSLNNQSVFALAVNGNNIFAGTSDSGHGVYLSTNNGTNWTQTTLNNGEVYSLAVNGNNVFAGTFLNGVFVSNNNGANWIQRNEGFGFPTVRALCIVSNYIFAGTYNGGGIWRRLLGELVGINPILNEIPDKFLLSQNYPNPFNPITKIKFQIPKLSHTKITVFDILGKVVATLVNEEIKPGTYEIDFNGSSLASGIYYYKLNAESYTDTKKMVLVK